MTIRGVQETKKRSNQMTDVNLNELPNAENLEQNINENLDSNAENIEKEPNWKNEVFRQKRRHQKELEQVRLETEARVKQQAEIDVLKQQQAMQSQYYQSQNSQPKTDAEILSEYVQQTASEVADKKMAVFQDKLKSLEKFEKEQQNTQYRKIIDRVEKDKLNYKDYDEVVDYSQLPPDLGGLVTLLPDDAPITDIMYEVCSKPDLLHKIQNATPAERAKIVLGMVMNGKKPGNAKLSQGLPKPPENLPAGGAVYEKSNPNSTIQSSEDRKRMAAKIFRR